MNRLFSLNRSRSLIRCIGQKKETSQFLQGMITNDMQLLDQGKSCIYTLFLNKLGRILYDSIIYKTSDVPDKEEFLIECDKEVVSNLVRHLKLYRVRRKVDISVSDEHDLWCFKSNSLPSSNSAIAYEDPRIKDVGYRLISKKDLNYLDLRKSLNDVPDGNEDEYVTHRYQLGVGEGIVDIPPEKSFPMEANCDFMNGVSFQKGCYIGQELTARTFHTGVVRKRLMPLIFDKPISVNLSEAHDIKDEQKKSVGKLRNVIGNHGLGLLRVEQVLAAKELSINENLCHTEKPSWWPKSK